MMDFLRNWLIGLTGASIILAFVDCLVPNGSVKQIGKIAGGLVMVIAIFRPVLSVDYEMMAGSLANYRYDAQQYSSELEIENERLKKIIIEDRTGAYIRDKAEQIGIDCKIAVQCRTNEKGQMYPASVTVYGELTQEQKEKLMRIIAAEVAIPAEMQRYERTIES